MMLHSSNFRLLTAAFIGLCLLVGIPRIAVAEGEWGVSVNGDRAEIWASERHSSVVSSSVGSFVSSSSVVGSSGVGVGDWEAEWERRVAKCEVLKISGGWDTDPECVGITWETDATPEAGTPVEQPVVPSASELIRAATATVNAQGAGLVVQPASDVLVSIPTLVHAASPTQTLTTVILGRQVRVDLVATSFSFDFGDHTPVLVSTSPGAPWPDKTNQHTYTAPIESCVVTLTTVWAGSVTSPFTGETARLDNVVTTVETSAPFRVRTPHIILTDTAEEAAGH